MIGKNKPQKNNINYLKNNIMKKYIFTDIVTGETFTVICEPYEVHSIELKTPALMEWAIGRIIQRTELPTDL